MNEGLFKSVAYAAKTRLNESGFDVRSGHLHEIIAALQRVRLECGVSGSSNVVT
jgi:hypothetical protein